MTNTFALALDTGQFYDGLACVDCYHGLFGDHWPDSDDDHWTTARQAESDRVCAEFDIQPGHVHHGEYASNRCFHPGQDCDDDCDCARDTFSTMPCDVCGSRLAGEREGITMVARALSVRGDLVTNKRESDYRYRAAREAFRWRGAWYADCIEAHTAELVAKGYDVADRSLGEALQGNDGI